MNMSLHLNIEDLLSAKTVESERIEYKEGWNPDAIYRTICAFANDFDNIGGGYILVGVEEDQVTKTARRPIKGLSTAQLSEIQRKMIGFNNLLIPTYHPHLFIEDVDNAQILVLWVPGGSNRPYQVPEFITAKDKKNFYYIRKYANSVKAGLEEQQDLLSLANQIPFDDRTNTQAIIEDISVILVKDYLLKVRSRLAEQVGKIPDSELFKQIELISGPNEHIFPKNVALMLFSENPEKYFPYSRVEIVEFQNGDAGEHEEQVPITGPIPEQIHRTLKFLKDKIIKEKVIKQVNDAESIRIVSYPFQAIEETLVNAFYHRDYQQREPIEIRIYPTSIIFINHGGPDRSIKLEAFNIGQVRGRRYRNRRLGEFLKELELTEGRATGIPTILQTLSFNGSPAPRFHSDDERTFFEVELYIHPAFIIKESFSLDFRTVISSLVEIDEILSQMIDYSGLNKEHDLINGTIAKDVKIIDNQSNEIIRTIDSTIVSTIGNALNMILSDNEKKILSASLLPQDRTTLLLSIGIKNLRKNYENHVLPMVNIDWIEMTIPDKPTSPNQKYLTTLKGRIVLNVLKKSNKL
jgi:ATP-dependent DNA helicase RecG